MTLIGGAAHSWHQVCAKMKAYRVRPENHRAAAKVAWHDGRRVCDRQLEGGGAIYLWPMAAY